MKAKLALAAAFLLAALSVTASASYVHWSAKVVPSNARAGEAAQIVVTAQIDSPWHIYQLDQQGGPNPTSFDLAKNPVLSENGDPVQPQPKSIHDPNFNIQVGEFENAVSFGVPVKIATEASGQESLKISVSSQTCNAHLCTIPATEDVPVSFQVASGPARPDHLAPLRAIPDQPAGYAGGGKSGESSAKGGTAAASVVAASGDDSSDAAQATKNAEKKGLLFFFGFAFLAGLSALATPCVFPMIPITVSYFAKAGKDSKKNYAGAFTYCFGIISTFSVLGLALSLIFGASGVSNLATNPYVNLILALLFLVLGISLLGVFEIRLPSRLVNSAYAGSRRGGLVGPYLMGLTFTLTSFTCTAPFAGAVLGEAAGGKILYPLLGMLAFGLAFSLPFLFLALFPQYLASLPKSGSWLSTVKGFMAFIEIAAAVKFLSNANLVWQLGWLTRPVFLAVWAIIGVVAALYLFGLVVIGHGETAKMGFGRAAVGVATLAVTGLFLSGVGGNTKGFGTFLLAWLPPYPYPGQAQMEAPGDLHYLSNYKTALAEAKRENKAVFVDFTGVTCTNCRAMEEQMFPKPVVQKLLAGYVIAQLYTDRPTPDDRFNAKLEETLSKQTTLPMYVIVTPEGKALKLFSGYTEDTNAFVRFLQAGQPSMVAQR